MSNLDELREKLLELDGELWDYQLDKLVPFISQYTQQETLKARFDELDLIPVIEAQGVGYETIVSHRKERYRLLYEQAKLTSNNSKEATPNE